MRSTIIRAISALLAVGWLTLPGPARAAAPFLDPDLTATLRDGADRPARVVVLLDGASPELGAGVEVIHRFRLVPAAIALVSRAGAASLAADERVRGIYLDRPQQLLAAPAPAERAAAPPAPVTADSPWGVRAVHADSVWSSLGFTGRGVTIAILDTGVDASHPDLAGRLWRNAGEVPGNLRDDDGNGYVDDAIGYDFSLRRSDPVDDLGHGTHIAGSAAGDGHAGTPTGVAPGAKIMPLKILTAGFGYESDAWEAMEYAVAEGADVINLSLGWIPCYHAPLREVWRDLVNRITAEGVVVVAAAGNEADDFGMPWYCPPPANIRTPADVPSALTVGACTVEDKVTVFSAIGPVSWDGVATAKPDVAAPGLDILSTLPGGGYSAPTWDGTSMAAPHVAGTVALMLSAWPELTPAKAKDILALTARDIGLPGPDLYAGAGVVDAYAAVAKAQRLGELSAGLSGEGGAAEPPAPPGEASPAAFALAVPAPNPFSPGGRQGEELLLRVTLRDGGPLLLTVHDARGRRIVTLADEVLGAGEHVRRWDGTDGGGAPLAPGVYWVRAAVDGTRRARAVLLLR